MQDMKRCKRCDEFFIPHHHNQLYCCEYCQIQYNIKKSANTRRTFLTIAKKVVQEIPQLIESCPDKTFIPASKQCLGCKNEFMLKHPIQKHCSERCRTLYYGRKYYAKNREAINLLKLQSYHKNKQLPVVIKHCAVCGTFLEGKKRKFCLACALDDRRSQNKEHSRRYKIKNKEKHFDAEVLRYKRRRALLEVTRAALEVIPTLKEVLPHD